MDIYEEKYDIRKAEESDIISIMSYIRDNWKKDHILARDYDYFCYEYVIDGEVCFWIAKDRADDSIKGILGYIYASGSEDKRDIWTVMWKVSHDAVPLLGLRLFDSVRKMKNVRNVIGVGDNKDTTVPMMKTYYKYFTGRLKHYYLPGKDMSGSIAKISKDTKAEMNCDNSAEIRECTSDDLRIFDFNRLKDTVPYKDEWYYRHRYFDNPVYDYKVYYLSGSNDSQALLVTRIQPKDGSRALRIIDYYGDIRLIGGIENFFGTASDEYEYLDFYCLGYDDAFLKNVGFIERTDSDRNIIPDHFNPYELKNIDIYCTSSTENTVFCKGDADQDRPS